MAVRVSKDNFQETVLSSALPVLVEFYSDGCIPCKQISPILGELEEEYEGRIKIVKVNITFDMEIADDYLVVSSPTMLFFQKGEPVDRIRGLVKKDVLVEKISKII